MVRTVVPLSAIVAGVNDLATAGWTRTSRVAVPAAALVPALVVGRAPAAIVFTSPPEAEGTTFTVTVQAPLAGTVAPKSATLPPFAPAVTAPPAHVVAPAGVAVFRRP